MQPRLYATSCVAALLALTTCAIAVGQTKTDAKSPTKFNTARDAYNVGAAMYNAKKYKESREAFEAAIALTEDDAEKVRAYRALMAVYPHLPENDPMFTAAEFIIGKADSDATRSLTRRSLLSFVYNRGLLDKSVDRYEKALKADAQDRTALYVLSEIYDRLRPNPQRRTELIERLIALQKEEVQDKPADVGQTAELARSYVSAKKYKEGAELYEKIAPLDENLAAWHWKEAAAAWLKANDTEKALAAAKKSQDSPPEKRSQLLTYFWHQALGDVFLEAGDPKSAVPHYEQALKNTDIAGYKKTTEQKLAEARAKAEKRSAQE